MTRSTRMLAGLGVAVSLILLAVAPACAQVVTVYRPALRYYPAPVVSYYYSPPVVYTPAPVVSYYRPTVSYYAPTVSYYAPAVSYYAPPVSYYVAPTAVTTTRYGPLGRLRYTTTRYYP
jgi:hypothetical protein